MKPVFPRGAALSPVERLDDRGAQDMASPAALLVGVGFRGWLRGLQSADMGAFHTVFQRYRSDLPTACVGETLHGLSRWVGAVRHCANRTITTASPECAQLCRDECLAVSIIAAAQNDTCPAMRACAFALLGNPNIDPVVEAAHPFANALARSGCHFTASEIASAMSRDLTEQALPPGRRDEALLH